MPLIFIWLLVFFSHQELTQEIPKKATSQSSTDLAPFSIGLYQADKSGFVDIDQTSQYTSFEGYISDSTHQTRSDGDFRSMEVYVLQKDFKSNCQWMQPVFDGVARLSRHYLCAAIQTAEIFTTKVLATSEQFQLGLESISRWKSHSQDTEGYKTGVATSEVSSTRTRQRTWQSEEEGAIERPSAADSTERKSSGDWPGEGERKNSCYASGHDDSTRTSLDTIIEQCYRSCSASTSHGATADIRGRHHIERIDQRLEKIANRAGSGSESHRPENHIEGGKVQHKHCTLQ